MVRDELSACRCSREWAPDHNTKPDGAHAGHLPTKCMLLSKISFRPTNAFLKRKHGKRRTFRLPLLSRMGSTPPATGLKSSVCNNLRILSSFQRDNSSASQASGNELLSTPRPPQCKNMYMRQNYPPGHALENRFQTNKRFLEAQTW